LQPADHVQANVRILFEQRRPFDLRLLDPVLAEIALAGGNEWFDLVGGTAFADGDQGNSGRFAARYLAGCGDSVADFGKPGSGVRD
jgi:hypothetical protein